MAGKTIPRGIRNNNPLNIRIGNKWQGEVQCPSDPSFEQFTAMEYGIRAGFKILNRYINRYKQNTIRKIVSKWAPSNENNTNAYVDFVAKQTRLNPDLTVRYEDQSVMISIVDAMIKYECGQSVLMSVINKGYQLAKY